MKKIWFLLLALAATGAALAAQPLLSPAELQAQLKDANLRVIDIRDAKSYAEQHIPGAVSAPYGKLARPGFQSRRTAGIAEADRAGAKPGLDAGHPCGGGLERR